MDKSISEDTIKSMIDYRNGNVDVGPLELEFLKNLGYILSDSSLDEEVVATSKDGEHWMTATQAYCYERYAALKKKVCEKLNIPVYVQLDLEYMLSTYFVHF